MKLYFSYVSCLFAFGALCNFKFYLIAFCQGFIAITLYRAKMDEYILTVLGSDKAVTLLI